MVPPLPAVTDVEQALTADSPVLFDHLPTNEAARLEYSFGEPAAAMDAAHRVVASI